MKRASRIRHNYEDKERLSLIRKAQPPRMAAGHQHSVPEIDHFYHKVSLVGIELPVKGFLNFYDIK